MASVVGGDTVAASSSGIVVAAVLLPLEKEVRLDRLCLQRKAYHSLAVEVGNAAGL